MSLNHTKSGPNSVPAYQMSGIPYVTGSAADEVKPPGASNKPIEIDFPYVTKFVTVRNIGAAPLRMAFSFSGSYRPGESTYPAGTKPQTAGTFGGFTSTPGSHYFLIPTGSSGAHGDVAGSIQTFEVRCKKLVFQADSGTSGFSLLAGLTTIPANQFPVLTGSITGSATAKYSSGVFPAFEGVG